MAYTQVSWAYGEVVSSTKLAAMVENLRAHHHAYHPSEVGSFYSQGADLGFRAWATGRETGLFVSQGANLRRSSPAIAFPAGRFLTPPVVVCSLETVVAERLVCSPETTRTKDDFVIELWTGTSATPAGGIVVQWVAFEPSSST